MNARVCQLPGKAPNTNRDPERSPGEEELAGEREHENAIELFVRALRVSEAVFGRETRKMAEDVQHLGRQLLQKAGFALVLWVTVPPLLLPPLLYLGVYTVYSMALYSAASLYGAVTIVTL